VNKRDREEPEPQRRAAAETGPEPGDTAELERLQAERDRLHEQLQRTLADLQNMRRRQAAELEEYRRRTLEGLSQELLPVLDNFHAALEFWDRQDEDQRRDASSLVEGVRMVRTLLTGAMERHGLQEIAADGQSFDPNLHEAVRVEPAPGTPDGQILSVLQRGYTLGDRVLRPSRVVVSGQTGGAGAPDDQDS
jgi:molecular chaperone GrpE